MGNAPPSPPVPERRDSAGPLPPPQQQLAGTSDPTALYSTDMDIDSESPATYYGPRVHNLPHGEGKLKYPVDDKRNRAEYSGHFVKGKRHGYGMLQWANGSIYIGEWANDSINGKGKLMWAGMTYEGEWTDNKFEGYGRLIYKDGSIYEGNFLRGKFEGHGTLEYGPDDDRQRKRYVGEWHNGKRHGLGRMEWTNGAWYDGEWVAGKRQGQGIHVFPGGESFSGTWLNGKREGYGVRKYLNGLVWEGMWKADKRHGSGTLIEAHGRRKNELYDAGQAHPHPPVPQDAQALLVLALERIARDPQNSSYARYLPQLPHELQSRLAAAQVWVALEPPAETNLVNLKTWFGV